MSTQIVSKKLLLAAVILALLTAQIAWPAAAHAEDAAQGAEFVFSDDKITVSPGNAGTGEASGYDIEGTTLTITDSGTYLVSGSCSSGQIKIKKGATGVTLILGGITLTSKDTAPINCGKSSQVSILTQQGTVNRLADAAANNDDNYPNNSEAENAVIKCKDGSNVTIGGTGSLQITAKGKNGIKSGATTDAEGSASLTIRDLTLSLTAPVNDAINAEALLTVESGKLSISAADDAIHCDYDLIIGQKGSQSGPDIDIAECYEGLEGAKVTVYSGDVTIHSSDDGINAANSDLSGYNYTLEIAGGNIYVDAETGDGLDSNGTLTISGGKTQVFSTSSGDNAPIDSDGAYTITGGTILAVGNSAMAQSPASSTQNFVTFGASMFSGPGGQPGQPPQPPETSSENQNNGQNENNTAGQTPPEAPPTGTPPQGEGTNPPSQPGSQPDMPGQQGISIAAKDAISITDSSNHTLCKATALRSANYVFYSDSALTKGETYTLHVNDSAAATAEAGTETQQTPPAPPSGENPAPGTSTDLSQSLSVALSQTKYVYNGKARKPAVTVRAGSKKLAKNTDYTVTYKNNKNVGTASVTITGKGSYTGTITKTFKILPKGTSIAGSPAALTKGFTVKWKKPSAAITGYQVQYAASKQFTAKTAATKTIRKASVKKLTVKKLKSGKTYYVRLRTYKTVNGKAYYSSWSKAKRVTTK